jgi:hypothetical protein
LTIIKIQEERERQEKMIIAADWRDKNKQKELDDLIDLSMMSPIQPDRSNPD